MTLPRSIDAIVAEQVERWRIEQAKVTRPPPPPVPVVAVSREYGARGAAVAHQVADRLGFSYWNTALVDAIARSAQVSAAMVQSLDEHHDPALLATYRELARTRLGASEYFDELVKVVHAVASRGRAVLVGRGIAFMLPPERVLRVRVVCPLDERVRGLCERQGLTAAAARAEITRVDAERGAFVRDHLGADVETPSAFDLHVNTHSFTVERAAELVVAAYRLRFGDVAAEAVPAR